MKRSVLLLLFIVSFTFPVRSQSLQEIRDAIIKFHECFNEMSLPEPHEKTIELSNGKRVLFLAQSDYSRSAFVSADQLLKDVRAWKESPYLWQIKHKRDNLAVMDSQNLTRWEVDSFDRIAQSYFTGNNATFHLAAHGLVDASGQAADCIQIGGQTLTAAETAELIVKSMDNHFHHVINAEMKSELQKFVVVVHSCHSADGEDNFSSKLSKELSNYINDVSVVGAPDLVYCAIDGDNYTEYVTTEGELRKENPQKETWKVYRNGKNTSQGKTDYKETIAEIQKSK